MEPDHTVFSNEGSREWRVEGVICIKRQREKRWKMENMSVRAEERGRERECILLW